MKPRATVAVLALLLAGLAALVPASPGPADAAAPPAAALMSEMESRLRGGPRIVRMAVRTTRPARPGIVDLFTGDPVEVWGIVNGDVRGSATLWVFTAPDRLAGTGLLIQDAGDPSGPDALWYRMRTFRHFLSIPRSSLKLHVPGTCLTYEDARALLSADRYLFRWGASGRAGGRTAAVLARPKSPAWAKDLGFSSLRVEVDRSRLLPQRIEYRGARGELLKTYELQGAVEAAGRWLPAGARVRDLESASESLLELRYWPIAKRIPETLLEPEGDERPLLGRLRQTLTDLGLPPAALPTATPGGGR